MLNQCLESLVQKVQSGVVINFEKTGPDPPLIGEGERHCMDTTTFTQIPVTTFKSLLFDNRMAAGS